MESPTITELRAAVQVGDEVKDTAAQAHTETIRKRHAAATDGPWYPVDLRHQQGGQIRLFAKGASGIIANVLRSGPNAGPNAEMLGNAHQDIAFLLAEVDRLRAELDRRARPELCPRCDSPAPNLHPAMQHEGEVQPCPDSWHVPA